MMCEILPKIAKLDLVCVSVVSSSCSHSCNLISYKCDIHEDITQLKFKTMNRSSFLLGEKSEEFYYILHNELCIGVRF